MSDAIVIAIITGVFGLAGKLLESMLERRSDEPEKFKSKSLGESLNPAKRGGILNPATVGLLAAGLVIGIGATFALAQPPATPPEMFVRLYWERVSSGKFDQSWTMLSDNFKCTQHPPCEAGNYDFDGYSHGFDDFTQVTVRNARVQDQNADTATVKADLEYHRKDGGVSTVKGLVFHLVTQPGSKMFRHDWQIDKVTVGP